MLPSLSELLELHRGFSPSADPLPEPPPRGPERAGFTLTAVVLSTGALTAALSRGAVEAPQCDATRAGELTAHGPSISTNLTQMRPGAALRELSVALGFLQHPRATQPVVQDALPVPGAMPVTTAVPPIPQAQTPVAPTGNLGPEAHPPMRHGGIRRATTLLPSEPDTHRPRRTR